MVKQPSEAWKKKFSDVEEQEKKALRKALSSLFGVSNIDTHEEKDRSESVSNIDTNDINGVSNIDTHDINGVSNIDTHEEKDRSESVSNIDTNDKDNSYNTHQKRKFRDNNVSNIDTHEEKDRSESVSNIDTEKYFCVSINDTIDSNSISNNDTLLKSRSVSTIGTREENSEHTPPPLYMASESDLLAMSGDLTKLGLYVFLRSLFPSGEGIITWRRLAAISFSSINRVRALVESLEQKGLLTTRPSSKGTIIFLHHHRV